MQVGRQRAQAHHNGQRRGNDGGRVVRGHREVKRRSGLKKARPAEVFLRPDAAALAMWRLGGPLEGRTGGGHATGG